MERMSSNRWRVCRYRLKLCKSKKQKFTNAVKWPIPIQSNNQVQWLIMFVNYLKYFKSISPGEVSTDLSLNILERSRESNSIVQVNNINKLQTEDVANAVISTLATPPTVLVSYFVRYLHFSYKYL